ncbi:MAG: hypothetical protein Q7U37_02820 [Gallionella sp.]|nr:hypothetical protein [Gallionella sp.]
MDTRSSIRGHPSLFPRQETPTVFLVSGTWSHDAKDWTVSIIIHELTEAECLTAFPVVKLGIEIILDAKIRALEEQKKLEKAALAIQHLAGSTGT